MDRRARQQTASNRQSHRVIAMFVQIEPALRNAPDRMTDQAKCDNGQQYLAKRLQQNFTKRTFRVDWLAAADRGHHGKPADQQIDDAARCIAKARQPFETIRAVHVSAPHRSSPGRQICRSTSGGNTAAIF
jgi:hypothetical protein